jgi:HYDIN/CFA65/VesB-like, Ig-like domain/Secretion system C-terminal sorting domain
MKLYIRAVLGMILGTSAYLYAGPPRIAFHDTTIVGGSQFDYAIYADSSLTGLNVSSYQIDFTFNTSLFTFDSASSIGTLTSGWGSPTVNLISPGRIRVAGAGGTDILAGTGKLVVLRFAANVFTSNSSGSFSFASVLLNEGVPPDSATTRNGTVTVQAPPAINVSPNTLVMTKGDFQQFNVSGGKSPYKWSSINPSIAPIDSATGRLTAQQIGFTKVICKDSSGYVDTTGTVEVRGMMLSLRDTSRYQGEFLDLPIYTTNLSGLGIVSGQLTISYNQNYWTPLQIITAGTLLQSATLDTFSTSSNQINVSFASSGTLSGSGVLLYLRMKASSVNYGGVSFSFNNILFNESLLSNSHSGTITVQQLTALTVNPSGNQSLVAGDSLLFSVSSGGHPPYVWSVKDPTLASISSSGWLKAIKGGIDTVFVTDSIGATGHSGTISLYDFHLSVPDTSVIVKDTFDMPLFVSSNQPGFISAQMKITYSTNSYVHLVDVVSNGTLTSSWGHPTLSFSTGAVQIAAAGVQSVTSGGTLFILRFAVPDSTPRPSTINISLSNVLFNEGPPLPLINNGYFTVTNLAVFGIHPDSATIQVPLIGRMDSASFEVFNSGTVNLTSSISRIGSSEFSLSTSSINVAPGDSAQVKVYYLPTNGGTDTATIRFNTNDVYHSVVNITVIGKVVAFPELSLAPQTINFDTVNVGAFRDTIILIENTGSDTLRITGISTNNPVFSARPAAMNVAPGFSKADTIRFTPSTTGMASGRILIVNNATTLPDTVYVSGVGKTSLGVETNENSPRTFSLNQNFPNPFNPTTTIAFEVPVQGFVTITVFDVSGREVSKIVNGEFQAGTYRVQFNGSALASGVYLYRMVVKSAPSDGNQSYSATKKLLLLK